MYAVIFRAKINKLDKNYQKTAEKMRKLAFEKYGCLNLSVVTEADEEIAVSYWDSLEDIHAWKRNTEHLKAQQQGKHQWYSHYQIDIVEVFKSYMMEDIVIDLDEL